MKRVLVVFLMFFVGFSAYANQLIERELTDSEKKEVESAVKDKLKDPYTADFKHNKLIYKGKDGVYCGRVNSKNSYGAYAGFTPFSVFVVDVINKKGDRVFIVSPIEVSDATNSLSVESTKKLCKENGYNL